MNLFKNYSDEYKNYLLSLPKEYFLTILENCFTEIFVADHEGRITYINPACVRHYGLSSEEMVGHLATEICQEKDLWEPYTYKDVVAYGKTLITENHYKVINQNLLSISVPVFDDSGNIEMMVSSTQDHFNKYDITYRVNTTSIENKLDDQETEIIGKSQSFEYCRDLLDASAATEANILLLGESGTGKSVLANYVHRKSKRKDKVFMAINCGAIPENLLESELFGYAPNAFTGASPKGKVGILEEADGGTLFLDEIGEMPLGMQEKILDVLENKRFIPVGSNDIRFTDVRIIAATNQDILKLVREKYFRSDLYYRLNTIKVTVPSLKDRKEDMMLLIRHFLNIFNKKYQRNVVLSNEVSYLMTIYDWPGNIRQLKNCIERMVILSKHQVVDPDLFHHYLKDEEDYSIDFDTKIPNYENVIEEAERKLIIWAYSNYKTSRRVAEIIEVSQTKANNLIRKYIK